MAVVGPVIARMRAKASRETAWQYIADPELRAEWWPDVELDVVFGGAVAERWTAETAEAASRNAVGTVDVLIEGHALGFRWRDGDDPHETAVLITFRSQGDETDIMVTETGFGVFPDAFERTADAQQSWIDLLTDYVAVAREASTEAVGAGDEVAAGTVDAADGADIDQDQLAERNEPAAPAGVAEGGEAAEAEVVDSAETADADDVLGLAELGDGAELGDEVELSGEGAEAEVAEATETAELGEEDAEAQVADAVGPSGEGGDGADETDGTDDAEDAGDIGDTDEADDTDALPEIESLFDADEDQGAESEIDESEGAEVGGEEEDEGDEEDKALDFDSLIRGDLGDKA
ncbi:SRPBCC domain-containing protein [Leucobacter sp. NPDC015123]|uniref:SRPBCC family protein n=1 Tax=Leucobacter sp. NPDC015123 TaxID=3364129 RepID=UPI0036F464B5